jgi:beta-mannosidase
MDSLSFGQESFFFELNGVPLFAKGANYIPQDPFQPRVGEEAYRQLIDNVCKANMNMLRVWGGGIYEEDLFYELCDEKGILVWQDFMFACAMYPGDTAFLENVKVEAIQNLKRLRRHPSIALWCGNNENKEGWHRWGWQPAFSEAQRRDRWRDYEALFHKLLPELVATYQPEVDYWPSSPSYGRGNPRHLFEGDSHYWGVWHDAEPFDILAQRIPRFMSEFGFQAFPGPKTIAEFSAPEDRQLLSPVMQAHQKHPRGNELIMTYLERDLPKPRDFDDFLYLSQLLQAEGMRLGLEAQRRARPFCMGTLYWQLNDCWPVASWSGLDYRGRWKALHYAVREAFAEEMISVEKREEQLRLWLVSDRLDTLSNCELQVELWGTRGRLLRVKRLPLELLPAQSQVYEQLSAAAWGGKKAKKRFLRLALRDGEGKEVAEKFFYFLPPKDLNLPRPQLHWEVQKHQKGYWIHLRTDKPARAIRLSHPAEGWFSDNYFDLVPGAGKSILFHTQKEIPNFTLGLKVRSLRW